MRIHPIIPIWILTPIFLLLCFFLLKKRQLKGNIKTILILVLLFLINLRFQIRSDSLSPTTNNLDVLFVIDTTISMNAEDGYQNKTRLENVKETCKKILEELNGARFSLITFDNSAKIITPFVRDINIPMESIEVLRVKDQFYAQGSSLNTPKEYMETVLKSAVKKEDRIRIVFFISDGEITGDEKLTSYSSLKKFIDGGAVLGFGTTTGGKMKVKDEYDGTESYLKYYEGNFPNDDAISKFDESNLQKIANDLKINYLHVENNSSIDSLLKSVKKNAISKLSDEQETGYDDIYYIFLIPLFILLLLEWKKL